MVSNTLGLVLKLIEDLSYKERVAVVSAIHRLNVSDFRLERDKEAENKCLKYSKIIQEVTGIWPITKKKDNLTVYCKRVLAKLLKDDGFTYYAIGRVMEIDHSTVVFHCKQAKSAEEYPLMYPEYNGVKKAVLEKLKAESDAL